MTTLKPFDEILTWEGYDIDFEASEQKLKERDAATAQVLCDLLEGEKRTDQDQFSHDHTYDEAIEKAQALIRQTLDPISSNER